MDKEIARRLAKASISFGSLRAKVWEKSGISNATKLKVYVCCPSLTPVWMWDVDCLCQTCQETELLELKKLRLRSIMRIRQEDRVPDTEVLERANAESVFSLSKRAQLRWAGLVCGMEDSRIPKQLLYGVLASVTRKWGRPKLRLKDTLKASMKDCWFRYCKTC